MANKPEKKKGLEPMASALALQCSTIGAMKTRTLADQLANGCLFFIDLFNNLCVLSRWAGDLVFHVVDVSNN